MDASSLRGLKPHLKQDEKSTETRRRLLEAGLSMGSNADTLTPLVRRSRSARDAQLYHFPTKEDLFGKAVEHLGEAMFNELRHKVEQLPVEEDLRSIANRSHLGNR
jgi:hypothetical protein